MKDKKYLLVVLFVLTVVVSGCVNGNDQDYEDIMDQVSEGCLELAENYSEIREDVEFECYDIGLTGPEIIERAPEDTKCYCLAEDIELELFVTPGDQIDMDMIEDEM